MKQAVLRLPGVAQAYKRAAEKRAAEKLAAEKGAVPPGERKDAAAAPFARKLGSEAPLWMSVAFSGAGWGAFATGTPLERHASLRGRIGLPVSEGFPGQPVAGWQKTMIHDRFAAAESTGRMGFRCWYLCHQTEAGFRALAVWLVPRSQRSGRLVLVGRSWKNRAAAAGSGVVRRRSGCLGLDPVFFLDGETALSVSYPNQGICHLAYQPLSFTGFETQFC